MRKTLLTLLALAALTACSPEIDAPSAGDAKNVVTKATYAQDPRTGICYSVVFAGRSNSFTQGSVSHTAVACDKIPAGLLAK